MILKQTFKSKRAKNRFLLIPIKNQKGVSAVIVAIVLAMLFGFIALAIDVGYLYATRNQLQNIADSSALAAAGELGKYYSGLIMTQQASYNASTSDIDLDGRNDELEIEDIAIYVASQNRAAGQAVIIGRDDIILDQWNWNLGPDQTLTNDPAQPNAVRVIARRDSTLNGAVTTFFAKFFGADTFQVTAVATAALSGPSSMDDGELITPFGVSKNNFEQDQNCGKLITYKDTPDSCAGWHNWLDPHNSNALRNKAYDIISGDATVGNDGMAGVAWLNSWFGISGTALGTPGSDIGDDFDFTGGVGPFLNGIYIDWDLAPPAVTAGGQVAPFPALFDYFRFRDGDGDDSIWTAKVPVYNDLPYPDCSNPSGLTEILGYAIIEIQGWRGPPDNEIIVFIDCDKVVIGDGRGGGGSYGNLLGSIPNLVQ